MLNLYAWEEGKAGLSRLKTALFSSHVSAQHRVAPLADEKAKLLRNLLL